MQGMVSAKKGGLQIYFDQMYLTRCTGAAGGQQREGQVPEEGQVATYVKTVYELEGGASATSDDVVFPNGQVS